MKLERVKGHVFYAKCIGCCTIYPFGDVLLDNRSIGGWADLDGKPFEAYYCNLCADALCSPRNPIIGKQEVEQR